MTPSEIIAKVRRLYNVDTTLYSDNEILSDLNELKNNFFSALVNAVEEDWSWDIWNTTSVDNQTEYAIPEVQSGTAGAKQIRQVSINYDGSTYENTGKMVYTPATLVNPNTLDNHWGRYEENQSKYEPIYFVADRSVFIAPVPLSGEGGVNRIELRGIKSIPDYTLATTETDMKLPIDVQQLLIQGLEPNTMRTKTMPRNEINSAIAEYERVKTQKIKEMTTRFEGATFFNYPTQGTDLD